jgi:hypothetical protein
MLACVHHTMTAIVVVIVAVVIALFIVSYNQHCCRLHCESTALKAAC